MKIRVRDHKLPSTQITKKFRPIKIKYRLLKWIAGALIIGNIVQFYYLFIK